MRDIDDWMFHFERRVGAVLKELFSDDQNTLPPELNTRLKMLGNAERSSERQREDPVKPSRK